MILLSRSRLKADIPPSLSGPDLLAKQQELLTMFSQKQTGLIKQLTFNSSYWSKAKPQLKKETFGKCAYCESPTGVVAHGDVEHFRPKSHYWWLAYCYDNYLFSCQICNQSHKGNKFPTGADRLQAPDHQGDPALLSIDPKSAPENFAVFHQQLELEMPELPNPYYQDPEPFFIWKADEVLREVEIRPNPDYLGAEKIYNACIECFGINRKELCTFRYQIFKNFKLAKMALSQPGRFSAELIEMATEQIKAMKAGNAPYAGMIRYFDAVM